MSECDGKGWCFKQVDNDTFIKKKGSKCKCVLQECPKCKDKSPQALLDCCEGFCQECAVEIYGMFKEVKGSFGNSELKLQQFADMMAEYYNHQ